MGETQTFDVQVYRDKAMTDLVDVVPIEDIGMMRSGRLEASGDDVLIHLAQELLRSGGDTRVSDYHYRVIRTR